MLWAVWFYHSSWLWRDPPFQGVIIHKMGTLWWEMFSSKLEKVIKNLLLEQCAAIHISHSLTIVYMVKQVRYY